MASAENNRVQIFDFKDQPVRIIDRSAELWFVAGDICRVLDLKNPRQVISSLQEDEKDVHSMDTPGGKQALKIISESGLYSLIFTSRKPSAQEFRRWVTHEVLPALRKTGHYEMKGFIEQTLPEHDPEIPRDNVISFLQRGPEIVRTWPLSKKIYFALCVRRFTKGFGIGWITTFDPAFGRIQVVPTALLHYVACEIATADRGLLSAGDDESLDHDMEELVRLLADNLEPGEKEQYTFQRVFDVAQAAGLFGLAPSTALDARIRSVLGKRITAGTGKRYGDVLFKAGGAYRRRFFLVRRLAANGGEITSVAGRTR